MWINHRVSPAGTAAIPDVASSSRLMTTRSWPSAGVPPSVSAFAVPPPAAFETTTTVSVSVSMLIVAAGVFVVVAPKTTPALNVVRKSTVTGVERVTSPSAATLMTSFPAPSRKLMMPRFAASLPVPAWMMTSPPVLVAPEPSPPVMTTLPPVLDDPVPSPPVMLSDPASALPDVSPPATVTSPAAPVASPPLIVSAPPFALVVTVTPVSPRNVRVPAVDSIVVDAPVIVIAPVAVAVRAPPVAWIVEPAPLIVTTPSSAMSIRVVPAPSLIWTSPS
mmetsp:Transcript_7149/g.25499  ORF Transcript_7149/g.25499 Transcript_7149/m.25499 type:complete len:277 (+) Transcript_7149:77-907(+)